MNIDQLRQAGFSDTEIRDHYGPELRQAGFSDDEINAHFGQAQPKAPSWWKTVKRPAIAGLRSVNVGLARTAEDVWKLHRKPGVWLGKALGFEDIEQEDPVLKAIEGYKANQEKLRAKADISERLGELPAYHPKRIVGTGVQALPQVAAMAGGGIMGGPGGAATMLATIAYGPAAEEAKAEGASEVQQVLHGITSAEVEVLTELPVFSAVGKLWKYLKKSGVGDKAATTFTKRLLKGMGLYGKGLALETGQEVAAYLGGQASKRLLYDPKARVSFNEAVGAGYGGLSMALVTGLIGAPGAAMRLAPKPRAETPRSPVADQAALDNLRQASLEDLIAIRQSPQSAQFATELDQVIAEKQATAKPPETVAQKRQAEIKKLWAQEEARVEAEEGAPRRLTAEERQAVIVKAFPEVEVKEGAEIDIEKWREDLGRRTAALVRMRGPGQAAGPGIVIGEEAPSMAPELVTPAGRPVSLEKREEEIRTAEAKPDFLGTAEDRLLLQELKRPEGLIEPAPPALTPKLKFLEEILIEKPTEVFPESIAKDLNLIYNGPQEIVGGKTGHLFTDPKTKSTFTVRSLEKGEVQAGLEKVRERYEKIKPTKPTFTPPAAAIQGPFAAKGKEELGELVTKARQIKGKAQETAQKKLSKLFKSDLEMMDIEELDSLFADITMGPGNFQRTMNWKKADFVEAIGLKKEPLALTSTEPKKPKAGVIDQAKASRQTFRISESTKVTNTQGKAVTLPKDEEYTAYDMGEGKIRLQDGKQVTVYEGELSKLRGQMLKPGEQPMAGGTIHRVDEIQRRAKKVYGTTHDPLEAGYILSDGSMLDFSGRHYASGYKNKKPLVGQPDYLKGQRAVDHRELEIEEIFGPIKEAMSGGKAMIRFETESNAIRFSATNNGEYLNVSFIETQNITKAQWERLAQTQRITGGTFEYDIFDAKDNKIFSGETKRIAHLKRDVKEFQILDQAKTRIKDALKDQRGSFSMKQKEGPAIYKDLLTVGTHILRQGHTKFSQFSKQLKATMGDTWAKVKNAVIGLFRDATKILKSERGAVTITGRGPEIPYGTKPLSPSAQKLLDELEALKTDRPAPVHKMETPTGKVGTIYNSVAANWRTRTVDRLYPLMQKLDRGLDITDPDAQAYIQGRMDASAPTVMATFFQHGKLKWLQNAPFVGTKDKGFLPLVEKHGTNRKAVDSYDAEIQGLLKNKIGYKPKNIRDIDRYLFWKVASRAEKLTKEGREHLFTKADIGLLKKIADKDWTGTALDKQYVDFNKNILDFAQEIGIIDPAMRNVWEHDEYIPFYRILEDELLGEEFLRAPFKTRKFIDSQIRKLTGGEQKLGDPFENILRNWSHLITESIRNRSRTTSYKYMQKLGYAEPSKPPKYIGKPEKEAILSYMVKGKRKYFKVKDLELFNALSGVNIQKFDGILMKMFGRSKRWLTYGATFGPAFRVANMMRDTLQTAMVNKSFLPVWDSLKGAYKAYTEHPDYVAMMSGGGGFSLGYVRGDDPRAMGRHIRKVVRKAYKKGNTLSPLNLLEWWEKVGSASENAARVQLYANLRKKGETHLVAGFKARDILDFSLSGDSQVVQTMIRTMPFLGARMQGLYKMGRAYGENKSAFLLKGAILAGLSLAWWAGVKDDERYKELEDWEKWTYRHFWIGDTHFRLPRAFEVDAIFSSSVETIADVLSGNEEGKHIMNFIGQTMRDTFALDVPQLVKPLYEQAKNEIGFTGRPIISESMKRVKPGEQAQPWTSESLRVLGEKLHVSPMRAEALVRGYLATLGMFILGGTDIITQWAFDFPVPPKGRVDDYPLVGRFVRAAPARHTKYITRFYEMAKEMDTLVGTINHYKRTGDREKAVELVSANRSTLRYKRGVNKIRKNISLFNGSIKQIHYRTDLTAKEKKEKINKLIDRKNEMVKKAYHIMTRPTAKQRKED